MDIKNLKKYFLSGSLKWCISGLIASVLSALWLVLKFSISCVFVKVYVLEVALLLAGPVLFFSTLRSVIRTSSLISKLKRTDSIEDVCRSFSNTAGNIYYNENEIILSDKYLFLKEEAAIIPYQQLKNLYTNFLKNDKEEITAIQLYCDTTQKKKIKIFPSVKDQRVLVHFVENIKLKNPNITINI